MTRVFGVWEPQFFSGIELFNRKKFFEAHEAWERLWMSIGHDDRLRDFYKGLIQAAAVYEHLRRNNRSGAEGLLKTASALLSGYSPRTEGLDVRALLADLERCRAEILDGKPLNVSKPPQLKLWIVS